MVYICSRSIMYLSCGRGGMVCTYFSRELITVAIAKSTRLNPKLIIPSILIPCCGIHYDTAAISLSAFHWLFKPDVLNPDVTNKVPVLKKQKAVIDCAVRSEEHTSELQSRPHLVCRLLLEKKK